MRPHTKSQKAMATIPVESCTKGFSADYAQRAKMPAQWARQVSVVSGFCKTPVNTIQSPRVLDFRIESKETRLKLQETHMNRLKQYPISASIRWAPEGIQLGTISVAHLPGRKLGSSTIISPRLQRCLCCAAEVIGCCLYCLSGSMSFLRSFSKRQYIEGTSLPSQDQLQGWSVGHGARPP